MQRPCGPREVLFGDLDVTLSGDDFAIAEPRANDVLRVLFREFGLPRHA